MGVLKTEWHGLVRPWSIRPCLTGAVLNKISWQKGYCFLLSHVCPGFTFYFICFPGGSYNEETQIQSLGREDPLKQEMAIHSSTLPWKIPWTEEHGRLQSMGSQRVRHDWATSLSFLAQRVEEISDSLAIWYSNILGNITNSQEHHGIFWKKQWYSTIW